MKSHAINLIAVAGCLVVAIAYTAANGPLAKIVTFVALGLGNLAFILAR
jgi:hypothetical protein